VQCRSLKKIFTHPGPSECSEKRYLYEKIFSLLGLELCNQASYQAFILSKFEVQSALEKNHH
jgi:hypothetical protein